MYNVYMELMDADGVCSHTWGQIAALANQRLFASRDCVKCPTATVVHNALQTRMMNPFIIQTSCKTERHKFINASNPRNGFITASWVLSKS